MNGSTITLPKKLFKDLWETVERFEQIQDGFENFVLSNDAKFLSRMRRAKKEHAKWQGSDWDKLKARYGI